MTRSFSQEEASRETYLLDPDHPSKVYVYRFANVVEPTKWISKRRQSNGDFGAPGAFNGLNDWAIKQATFGSSAEDAERNTFISVATDFESRSNSGEGWVQRILSTVSHYGKFSVPFATLFRSRPLKPLCKRETEWLCYDGEHTLMEFWVARQSVPLKK